MVKTCAALLLLVSSISRAQAPAERKGPLVNLTQKQAAELVLKNGLKSKEVNYKYQSLAIKPFEALSAYDWKLTAETGSEKDKTESFSLYDNNPEIDRLKSSVSLSKSLITGTTLTFDYSRLSQKYIQPVNNIPVTLDTASLKLEQSLLGNFFGIADRAKVNSAEAEYSSNLILRVNELEDLVLETLRQFWNTYVAQENFQEALNAKDRYEKLVGAVKRKASHGYSSPGELSQVQAEYETRIQTVKNASIEYLKNLENLITLLGMESGADINFIVPTSLPSVPQLKFVPIEDRRAVRSQKKRVESAELALRAAESSAYPTLNLVGIVGSTGLADSTSEAFSELNSRTHPKTYVGIKFEYKFGSDLQSQTEFNKRVGYDLEQAKLKRALLEETDRELQAERKVAATYAIAQSAKIQKEFREKAVQELNRSYNQGRTDISVLIEAMNKYFTSEVQYARAIGDYQIALNEWAAVRDELIPGKEEN